jgi:hypothetical protein
MTSLTNAGRQTKHNEVSEILTLIFDNLYSTIPFDDPRNRFLIMATFLCHLISFNL